MIMKKPSGRPSKGERHAFATRVPMVYAERVVAGANETGLPYGEFIARLIALAFEAGLDDVVRIENPHQASLLESSCP